MTDFPIPPALVLRDLPNDEVIERIIIATSNSLSAPSVLLAGAWHTHLNELREECLRRMKKHRGRE